MRACWSQIRIVSVFLFLAALPARSQCVPSTETTIYGGNDRIVIDERKPLRRIRGTVVTVFASEPWSGVLVEVFDHPEGLLQTTSSAKASQTRLAACKTNHTGTFSFDLPSGDYEVRFSYANCDVTSAVVRLRKSLLVSRRSLVVKLQNGT